MRAMQLQALDGPDGLAAAELDVPKGGTDILIDVSAAGVSFPDLLMSRGLYQMRPPLPFVPGVEVSGTVRSAPEGSGFTVGQRVAAFTMLGGLAEVAGAAPGLTWAIPEGLSDPAAAGFILNYHTALFALEQRGGVRPGETVVIHGAAGGLGSAAVQVARGLGAHVVAVTSSDVKAEVARRAGADAVVDSGGDWAAELRRLNDGAGADLILDPVGGDRFDGSLRCLAPGGRLVVVGFTEGRIPEVAVNRLLLKNISVVGAAWGAWLGKEPGYFAQAWGRLEPMIRDGVVAPIVGATFPLGDAAAALRLIESRQATGKVVVTL